MTPDQGESFGSLLFAQFFLQYFFVFPTLYLMDFFRRKVTADFQARVGPNRIGGHGFFQGWSDTLKLIQKGGFPVFWKKIAIEATLLLLLCSNFALIPYGQKWIFNDGEVGILAPFFVFLLIAFLRLAQGLFFGGFMSVLVEFRRTAAVLSALFPILIVLLTVGLGTGDLHWKAVFESQSGGIFSWTLFKSPLGFGLGVVFFISGLILVPHRNLNLSQPFKENRFFDQFDGSGTRFAFVSLSQFFSIYLYCLIFVLLFCGGSSFLKMGPKWLDDFPWIAQWATDLFLIHAKVWVVMFGRVWIEAALPDARIDQATDFCWKILSPMALLLLLFTGFFGWLGGIR